MVAMKKNWRILQEEWLKESTLPSDTAHWAIQAINKNENVISKLEEELSNANSEGKGLEKTDETIKDLRKAIKNEITNKENELDNLALNSANSSKLQLSVPSYLNYLMKAWAAAEGRDLSSVAMLCMETGFRDLKSKGSIPSAALKRYEIACEKRIGLAEANNLWEKHDNNSLKK